MQPGRINDHAPHGFSAKMGMVERVEKVIRPFVWVLVFLSGAFSCAADGHIESVSGQLSSVKILFGSQVILSTLWTSEALNGPSEKQNCEGRGYSTIPLPQEPPVNSPVSVPPEFQNSIRSVIPRNHQKVIAITFDLCESANRKSGYDADIVNYLREHRVKATFFAGGLWMASHPEKTLQLMADPLFEMGNHAWSHANFLKIDAGRMRNEILQTQHLYETYREILRERVAAIGIDSSEMDRIPSAIRLFRFPYGTCTPQALDLLKQIGLPAIQWNVVSGDPSPDRSPAAIAEVILQQSRPGSIIICHANGRGHGTSRALPIFIPTLRERGFEFVTVSELLNRGTPVAVRECYELMPGDTLRYDNPHKERRP